MGWTKNLFLGVYMENGLLRLLFLPLCYVLLTTPVSFLVARYFGLDQVVGQYLKNALLDPDLFPQVSIAFLLVFIITRKLSGSGDGTTTVDGKRRVQLLPFWVPGVRHWGNVVLGGERWLKAVRDSAISPVIGYSSSGMKHNVVFSPSLLQQMLENVDSLDEPDITKWITKQNGFGLSSGVKSKYLKLCPSISETLGSELFKGKKLNNITSASLKVLSESLPDLITFNSSIVDQLQWERVAGVELTDGTNEAETDLFELINEFFCNAILSPITGPQFTESYQLLASDLSAVNQSYYALVLGIPRFFPLAGLPGASLAKKRLLDEFTKFYQQLSDSSTKTGDEETDAESPTPLTALNDLFSENNLPASARASITVEIIHRIVAQAVPLAFWTILHIHRLSAPASTSEQKEQSPVGKIRRETKDWAKAVQPPAIHESFPCAPEITFTSAAPLSKSSSFPTVSSCISEAKRLYASSIAVAKINKPIVVTDSSVPGKEEVWWIEKGTYLDIGLSQRLINTSPANYVSPEAFSPGRFASSQPASPLSASIFDDSDELVTALLIALVTGVVQLWDIQAGGTWEIPETMDGASVLVPNRSVKVRVRRREGLEGAKATRKGK